MAFSLSFQQLFEPKIINDNSCKTCYNKAWFQCTLCDKNGLINGQKNEICPNCNATKWIKCLQCRCAVCRDGIKLPCMFCFQCDNFNNGNDNENLICPNCNGTKYTDCPYCFEINKQHVHSINIDNDNDDDDDDQGEY